ncbi:MAG: hypothetical protein WDW36_004896 [Sanguina aurantia]
MSRTKALFRIASMFVNMTETMAEYGFMGLAVTVVTFAFLYTRRYFGVNAVSAYRSALIKLNMSPAVLEVMGAPLAGSSLRAYVVTGGGLYLSKALRPKVRPRRIQMIFPLTGRERTGMVSMEAKKKQGRYVWKLLAVDIRPAGATLHTSGASGAHTASGGNPDGERIYVEGDLATYKRGGAQRIAGPLPTEPTCRLLTPTLMSSRHAPAPTHKPQALSLEETYELEEEVEEELALLESSKSAAETAQQQAEASAALAAAANAEAAAAAAAAAATQHATTSTTTTSTTTTQEAADPHSRPQFDHMPPSTQARPGSAPISQQQDQTPTPRETEVVGPCLTRSSSGSSSGGSGSSGSSSVSSGSGVSSTVGEEGMEISGSDKTSAGSDLGAGGGGGGAVPGRTLWQRWFGPPAGEP